MVRRARGGALGALIVVGTAGCAGDHNMLDPQGPEASRISAFAWGMMIAAGVITLIVFGLLVAAMLPGERRGLRRIRDNGYLIGGGIVMPVVVLVTLSGFAMAGTDALGDDVADLQIEVTGHQYWWEVRYPGTDAVTANEIHIPAGREVRVLLRSDDVIHSFWVPALAGKIDMVPGRTNDITIEADEPGVYRGQCAEFCGTQHALMAMLVIAEPPAEFDEWLAAQASPAETDEAVAEGRRVFLENACAGCHTIRGTEAEGELGPDLTHVAARRTLAAATVENTPGNMAHWIEDPADIKEGSLMPPVPLTDEEIAAVVEYLESLE